MNYDDITYKKYSWRSLRNSAVVITIEATSFDTARKTLNAYGEANCEWDFLGEAKA